MLEWRLFRDLPEVELRRLVAIATRRVFLRGEVVFHRGDPADSLHLIASGRFAARITTQLGDTVIVSLHGPGQAFGEMALIERGSARSTTVAALEHGETHAIHHDDFARLRAKYPSLNELLVQLLAADVRRMNQRLVEAVWLPAEKRVLRGLLELADFFSDGQQERRVIPLSQQTIAALAATSRVTVNRVLREETQRGTLELHRSKTVVLDRASLARRATGTL